jgi:hypothetical protein
MKAILIGFSFREILEYSEVWPFNRKQPYAVKRTDSFTTVSTL